MAPSGQEIKFATDALRKEGDLWQDKSGELTQIVSDVGQLQLGVIEAGIFQIIRGPNNDVVTRISTLCGQGATEFTEIGDTLRKSAKVYDAEEAENAHAINKLY